jgi:hypothetical protein
MGIKKRRPAPTVFGGVCVSALCLLRCHANINTTLRNGRQAFFEIFFDYFFIPCLTLAQGGSTLSL